MLFTSSEPLSDEVAFCCWCCFLSTADLCTASILGLDFQNWTGMDMQESVHTYGKSPVYHIFTFPEKHQERF